ncbi:hypothetical protein M413DRAFT_30754 [Hebeloma cylindrosporum]|uniref:Uncharacterized protein n=1 Tax=Hebeloma cylindrosporum TaxID=76867 RepID=A0A0C2XI87_HEBCY|nr:hypothetical protein M413DRAFT_30754 [Hebeloma cylindrosporum h7]
MPRYKPTIPRIEYTTKPTTTQAQPLQASISTNNPRCPPLPPGYKPTIQQRTRTSIIPTTYTLGGYQTNPTTTTPSCNRATTSQCAETSVTVVIRMNHSYIPKPSSLPYIHRYFHAIKHTESDKRLDNPALIESSRIQLESTSSPNVPIAPASSPHSVSTQLPLVTSPNQTNKSPATSLQLVFIEGASSNNDDEDAKSSLGIIIGDDDEEYRWNIPVDYIVDPEGQRED